MSVFHVFEIVQTIPNHQNVTFTNKTRPGNSFHFKDRIRKDLTFGVVYKFQCGLCSESYYGECVRHLNVRIDKHISPPTKNK